MSAEAQGEFVGAVDAGRGAPGDRAGDGRWSEPAGQDGQRLAQFGAGERGAEAVVHAAAEEQRRDLTGGGDVEGVAAGDGPRIAVRRAHTDRDDGAGGDMQAVVVEVLGGEPEDGV